MSCQIVLGQAKLSSEIMADIQARCIGPAVMSGRITSIAGVNANPRIIYVGSAGGGIWKTENAGISFKPIFDAYCQSIGALAIDQQRPDTIWAGTGESNVRSSVGIGNGIYRSIDGGKTWTLKGLEKSEHIGKILLHPADSNILFVAVPGALWGDSEDRGLYKSSDGGESWSKSLYIDAKTGCTEIFMDPVNPDIMYATMVECRRTPYSFSSGGPETAIYKSLDGGAIWSKITGGLPAAPYSRISMTMAPQDSGKLYSFVQTDFSTWYVSADHGEYWTPLSSAENNSTQATQFRSLIADPFVANKIYQLGEGLSISSDGGLSFEESELNTGELHSGLNAIWIDPKRNNHIYLGTDGGLYESLDGGNNFAILGNLPISQINHISIDQQEPYNIYGGLEDNGTWQGPSFKIGGIRNSDWAELSTGNGNWVVPDLRETDIVFAEGQLGDILRINKRTLESQSIKPYQIEGEERLRFNKQTPIVASPTDTRRLYIGAQYLYVSRNQGRDWDKLSDDLSTNDKAKQASENEDGVLIDDGTFESHCSIFAIAESPLDSNLIYVGTDDGKLQKTTDQGKTWQDLDYSSAGIPAGTWVSNIEPSRFSKNVVYATFDNHANGDQNTYLAFSRDGGLKWERIQSAQFKGYAHEIKEDLRLRSLLFLGTEMGLFISVDAGKNWARYQSTFPPFVSVRDIAINGKTNDLIIGTHGRGIYIVDDLSILRQMTSDLLSKNAAVLDGRPGVVKSPTLSPKIKQSSEFIGKNYTEEACITYYLKDQIDSSDIQVELYNKSDSMIYRMPGTTHIGINKLYWNMRMNPPVTDTLWAGNEILNSITPLLDPGEYRIKLRIDTIVYLGKLNLIEDPKSQHSAADKALQRKTAKELMAMEIQLNKNAQNIVRIKDALHKNIPEVNSGKDQKILADYEKALEQLRKKILGTKEGKSIHGEEPLLEKLHDVYQGVCSYDGRPSNEQLQKKAFLETEIIFYQAEIAATHELYLLKSNKIFEKNGLEGVEGEGD
ncbi:MAG: glycosyl hydrolase [Saprospiraceae bacterium]